MFTFKYFRCLHILCDIRQKHSEVNCDNSRICTEHKPLTEVISSKAYNEANVDAVLLRLHIGSVNPVMVDQIYCFWCGDWVLIIGDCFLELNKLKKFQLGPSHLISSLEDIELIICEGLPVNGPSFRSDWLCHCSQ